MFLNRHSGASTGTLYQSVKSTEHLFESGGVGRESKKQVSENPEVLKLGSLFTVCGSEYHPTIRVCEYRLGRQNGRALGYTGVWGWQKAA